MRASWTQKYAEPGEKPRKKRRHVEQDEQIKFFVWLDNVIKVFGFHIPNGGKRNVIEAAKLKRMGTKPGLPDVWVPIARKGYHALTIEIKEPGKEKASKDQERIGKFLLEQGNYWTVCDGCEPAKKVVEWYFS